MSDDVFADMPDSSPAPTAGDDRPTGGDNQFSKELVAKKIKGRQRTFYVDLKESMNGKFVKISEVSRGGQRSTIMFDGEDIDAFLEALQEIKAAL